MSDLRFIERDGRRILQQHLLDTNPASSEVGTWAWHDVPLVVQGTATIPTVNDENQGSIINGTPDS